ncbi:MAG: CinA family nicotinamide mononucleotide deamidase-related protein [Dehalococcoidia bacterium]|jgi:nicotinamide-nucleotide amidase
MDKDYHAEIIAVGTELLRGEITDTNSGYLATQLPLLGVELTRMTTAGDDLEQLGETLRSALNRVDIVLITGGLGPTEDDLTREAIAAVMDETPEVDAELEDNLRRFFQHIGRDMPLHNLKQAWLIPSAESMKNPLGTAPGWWVRKNGKAVAAIPGPPREMTAMWSNEVAPRLKEMLSDSVILSRSVKTYGIPEAEVAELVQPFFEKDNPSLGIYARPDGIQLRLIASGDDAEKLLDDGEKRLYEIFGTRIWGKEDDTLEVLIAGWLTGSGLTLAVMEDSTGGFIANILTQVPGSERFFRGGMIVNSANITASCGVSEDLMKKYGAISPEVTEVMALAVRERFSADIGLSTSGVMKEADKTGKRPGLTYVGIADAYSARTWGHNYSRFREHSGQREAVGALFRLRQRLAETGVIKI